MLSTSTPGSGGRSSSSSPPAESVRGPSATVCQPKSGAAGAAGRAATNVPAPGPRLEQPAGGEQRDGTLHGDRPDVVPGHQLAHGREPRAGLELGGVTL